MSEQVSAVCCSDCQSADDSLLTASEEPVDAQHVVATHASAPKVHAGIPPRLDGWPSVSGEGVPCGRRDDSFINEGPSAPEPRRGRKVFPLNVAPQRLLSCLFVHFADFETTQLKPSKKHLTPFGMWKMSVSITGFHSKCCSKTCTRVRVTALLQNV